MEENNEVVIVGAVRTPIGKFGGVFSNTSVVDLGATVIKGVLERSKISPKEVDEVIMGCVLQAGNGQNVARQASVKAGLSFEVPAQTLNIVCGSGLKCVNIAASLIKAGEADVIVAGGMENMSRAPFALNNARYGYRMGNGSLIDTLINEGLTDAFNNYHMGITAENVAEKYGVTREQQDLFAASSQKKTQIAIGSKKFTDEIVPVPITVKKKTIMVTEDEFPRIGVTPETLSKLNPAFKKNGTVTAGNSSGINDGAAAVIVMSGKKAKELGIKPLIRWVAGATAGVNPEIMGIAPVYSTKKVLEKTGMTIDQIDLIEANEAFAAQALAVGQELGWDAKKVNVNGGAISLGHPLGASGARILVTLIHEIQKRQLKYGLATLCVGGGMGVSTIIERI